MTFRWKYSITSGTRKKLPLLSNQAGEKSRTAERMQKFLIRIAHIGHASRHIFNSMNTVIIYALICGAGCCAAGGAAGAVLGRRRHTRTLSFLLAFSCGVMLAAVFFDLLPDARLLSNMLLTSCAVGLGAACALVLSDMADGAQTAALKHHAEQTGSAIQADGKTRKQLNAHTVYAAKTNKKTPAHSAASNGHQLTDTAAQSSDLQRKNTAAQGGGLLRTALMLVSAIAFVNLTKGLALGSGELIARGGSLAALIGFVNLTEGAALAASLSRCGIKPLMCAVFAGASGLSTLVGALGGYFFGAMSPYLIATFLAVSAGAMLFVGLSELYLQSFRAHRGRLSAFAVIFGVICGMYVIFAFA